MVKCSADGCKADAFKEGVCIDHYRTRAKVAPSGAAAPAAPAKIEGKIAAPKMEAPAGGSDWKFLQKMIFTRWVNQKLQPRGLRVENVVTDLGTGIELVALIEVLSEKTCPKKLLPKPVSRVQKIDNLNNALNFAWAAGVTVELKPSAENLLDGEERQVLGLIWGIMRTFLKFGDDEDSKMSAPDALRMWVQNQVAGYKIDGKQIEVNNFTTSFHDGMVLCALLHHFRPRLVPWESLEAKNWEANLNIAFDAAEKFFGLDKYLTAADIRKLDDKSMVIYVSEYYNGVAAQRKMDLAAKRIGKLINFASTNDKMKKEFLEKGQRLKATMERAGAMLGDRTVDNTMAGAKKRLEDFNSYKLNDKSGVINDFLAIENLMSHLSMRMAEAKRPLYVPPEGMDISGLRAGLNTLEEHEKERKVALHAELNRQIKLATDAVEHKQRCDAVATWGKDKKTYIDTKEEVNSVSEADFHLNKLSAFLIESEALQKGTFQEIKRLGKELGEQKFEGMAEVSAREAEIDALFAFLNELAAGKKVRLDDDLEREKFKEAIRAKNQQHVEKTSQLQEWTNAKQTYLSTEEKIGSVREAQLQLTLLKAYAAENAEFVPLSVPPLEELGKAVRESEYKKLTEWKFEKPDEVTARENTVRAALAELDRLYTIKANRLADLLALEEHKERLRAWNRQHLDRFTKIMKWVGVQTSYLAKVEDVDSITKANAELNSLRAYENDKVVLTVNQVKPLKELGAQINSNGYKSDLVEWQWEDKATIAERESKVDAAWAELSTASATKLAKLEDDLLLQKHKEKLRQLNAQHIDRHRKIKLFIADADRYLEQKETITSISEAELALTQLRVFESDKKARSNTNVAPLKALGAQIAGDEYKSSLNAWKWETPAELKEREDWVDAQWERIDALTTAKLARLVDDLAREKYAEQLRTWNRQHKDKFAAIEAWVKTSEAYLAIEEKADSISSANEYLNALKFYEADKVEMTQGSVEPLKALGKEILTGSYQGITTCKWESPAEVTEREAAVDAAWARLADISAKKLARLEDELEREKFKNKLRLWNADHKEQFAILQTWIADSIAYTTDLETITSIGAAQESLSKLSSFEADKVDEDKAVVQPFTDKGKQILTAEYKGLSSAKWESPEEITSREKFVADAWVQLADLSAKKLAKLKDDLAREQFSEGLRLSNSQHIDVHAKLTTFINESAAYLAKEEKVTNIATAQLALAQLAAFEAQKADTTKVTVGSLKAIGNKILTAEYKGLSSAKWETPEEIKTREQFVDDKWAELATASAAKKAQLDAALALEVKKEQLRLTFAAQAGDFTLWTKETSELAANSIFGFNLEEVERFDLASKDAAIAEAQATKTAAWMATYQEITDLKVTENIYTTLTPADLNKSAAALVEALAARKTKYAEDLARKRSEDDLCRAFAALVDPFIKQIDADKDAVTKSTAELEVQLADVEARITAAATENKKLDEIKAAQQAVDDAGIKNNRHSAVTAKDVAAQWEQYTAFLQTKKQMINDQINAKKLRGVTPEQAKEIEQQFKQFDKDGSGELDLSELRTCLYSLGNDFGKKEVSEIMEKYGKGEGKDRTIPFVGFKEFMIKQLGDNDSKEDVLSGFDAIMKGAAAGDTNALDDCLNEEQVRYIRGVAPDVAEPKAGTTGKDYRAWLEQSL